MNNSLKRSFWQAPILVILAGLLAISVNHWPPTAYCPFGGATFSVSSTNGDANASGPHQGAWNSLLLNPTMKIMKLTGNGCFGKSRLSAPRNTRNFNNGESGGNTRNGKNKSRA